jgi:hypothetical protein
MWKWKHFDTLDGLLDFVNEHELDHDQFKIVNSRAPRRSGPTGTPMYLIYRAREEAEEAPTLATAEARPLRAEQESALDAVEEILHNASDSNDRR